MPSSYREIISQVRQILLEPHPAHPKEPLVWQHLRANARLLFNQALNTPVSWALASTLLDVDENNDVYLLNASNFGKDVLVETIDDADPNHISRPLRRMSMASSLLGGSEPYAIGGYYSHSLLGSPHSAHTVVIFREDGAVRVKVLPKPHTAAQYRFWYEVSGLNTDALDNFFAVPAGEDLLCLRTALSCLPGSVWPGFTSQESADKRRELAVTLAADVKDHQAEYKHYIATDRQPGITEMRGFQDDEYRWG